MAFTVVPFTGTVTVAFAEDYMEFRGGDIDCVFPEGTKVTEFEEGNRNVEGFEEIFLAEHIGGGDMNMEAWNHMGFAEDNRDYSTKTEGDARWYFDEHGRDYLEDLFTEWGEREGFKLDNIGEEEFHYEGDADLFEWTPNFISVPVTIRWKGERNVTRVRCFIKAATDVKDSDLRNHILVFYNNSPTYKETDEDVEMEMGIVRTYEGLGYESAKDFRNGLLTDFLGYAVCGMLLLITGAIAIRIMRRKERRRAK